jgi:hypothetical protein
MAQKTYFSRITADHWSPKNNLHKAVNHLAVEMDRRLISEDKILDYRVEFLDKLAKLNNEHNRCKPLHISFENHDYANGDYWIYCDGVFNMSLFLVRDKN